MFGASKQQFFSRLRLDLSYFDQPMARVPSQVLLDAWREATTLTNEPCLSVKLGSCAHPSDYLILGQIMMSAATLGEAIDLAAHFQVLITNSAVTGKEINGDEMIYLLELSAPMNAHPYARCPVERQFAGFLTVCRFLTHDTQHEFLRLNAVRFSHLPATDPAEYEALFGCKVIFGCPRNELRFERALLELPIRCPDRQLLPMLVEAAQSRIRGLTGERPFTEQLQHYLSSRGQKNLPSAEVAARHFNVSVSTLKRKLRAEGTTYQDVGSEVKRNMARYLLQKTQYPVSQIAYMLGYEDDSGFYAAFKRWFGLTPQQFRSQAE